LQVPIGILIDLCNVTNISFAYSQYIPKSKKKSTFSVSSHPWSVEFRNAFEATAKSAKSYFPEEEDLVWMFELPLFAGAGVERSSSSFPAEAAFDIRRCNKIVIVGVMHVFTISTNNVAYLMQTCVTYDATADRHVVQV